jgi:ribosomal protein L7/L12
MALGTPFRDPQGFFILTEGDNVYQVIFHSSNSNDLRLLSEVAQKMGVSIPFPVSKMVDKTPQDPWNKINVLHMFDELHVAHRNSDTWIERAKELIEHQNKIGLIKHIRNFNNVGFGLVESTDYVESLLNGGIK